MPDDIRYVQGLDIPDEEVLVDSKGRVVDDAYTDAAVDDAERRLRGRPSLSRSGESPLLRVRLPRELDQAVRHAAERQETSTAEWVRRVLAQAAAAHDAD